VCAWQYDEILLVMPDVVESYLMKIAELRRLFERSVQEEDKKPKIGLEVEKIGLDARTGKSVSYTGKRGYLAILGKMYEELGWQIVKQKGKNILQMERCGAALNLESDGRIELAGSPQESIHDLAREFRIHQNEIAEISKIFGVAWLGMGFHPVSKNKEIQDLYSMRKELIVQFFKKLKREANNDYALAWWKKTAGIHANIDYFSEEDFARKARVFYRLAPLLIAIFASSPFSKGKFTGYMSYRYNIILNNGVSRFLIPQKLYDSDFGFDAWLEHVVDLPLLLINRGEKWLKPRMTFKEYMDKGYRKNEATMDDFDMHIKSVWMDLKLKSVIELRCIDSLPPSLVPSVAALIKGLAYNETALCELEKMVKSWTCFDYVNFQQDVAKQGLKATIQGTRALDLAKEVLTLAEESLKKDRIVDAFNNSEAIYLDEIKKFIFVEQKSPAEWLIRKWEGEWRRSFFPVFEWCQY